MSRPLAFLLLAAGTPALGYAPKLTFGRTAAHAANGLDAEPKKSVLTRALGQSPEASPEAIGVDGTVYMWMGKYLTAFRANGTIEWTFSPRGITYGRSFPALSADGAIVYVGGYGSNNEGFYAINAASGEQKWALANGTEWTPALSADGATLYIGSGGVTGGLCAVDAASGNKKWVIFELNVVHSPVLSPDGETVYVETLYSSLTAIDAARGEKKWVLATVGSETFLSPAFSPDSATLYIGSYNSHVGSYSTHVGPSDKPGSLYAVNTTSGEKKWVFAWRGQDYARGASLPVISADGATVYVDSWDGNLYAIDAARGKKKWAFASGGGDGFRSSPVLSSNGETLYVTSHASSLYAVHAASGKKKWAFATGGEDDSSPTLSADDATLYTACVKGGMGFGSLCAVDAASGKKKWVFDTGDPKSYPSMPFYHSPALSLDGATVYVGDTSLYAVDAASGAIQWNCSRKVEYGPDRPCL